MKIFRKNTNNDNGLFLYTYRQLDAYEKYIKKEMGHFDDVIHEIYSPDIHLDIIIVPPSPRYNFYKLYTEGMGAYKMNVPPEFKNQKLERAELVIYLPPTWNINSTKEEDYWPIKLLKTIARIPITSNSWLTYGHTISFDKDNTHTPFAKNTKLCSAILFDALDKSGKPLELKIKNLGKINFYEVFPLYEEELNYKIEKGLDALYDKLYKNEISSLVDINRKNVVLSEDDNIK